MMVSDRRFTVLTVCILAAPALADTFQPKVAPGANEPSWADLLRKLWGLDMDRDLRNPLTERATPAGLFQRARRDKPVTFTPAVALGLESPTRGGWYPADPTLQAPPLPQKRETWSYAFKQPADQQKSLQFTLPPLAGGKTEFDPGDKSFGLWISNDGFTDGGVYTQPAMVARYNDRLKAQPYKAMIYPNRDLKTGKLVADSYIIGFEYSTNDDFQDVVVRIDNAKLLPSGPPVPGVLDADARVRKLAGGFAFTEGPAWSPRDNALYFSDIPRAHIIRHSGGKTETANSASGQSNGLMFDKSGALFRCEHAGRRVSRGMPAEPGTTIVDRYQGKRLNSPNDLWMDESGGIYFTDPRYGPRHDLELDKEAVYYVTADGGSTVRIIDDLVRPNGIALSPDGRTLYVVDNGADSLHRYPVTGPGKIGKGERIANVTGPDGMTVDAAGRLYVTCAGGVWVLDANGKWLGLIETPEQPANCTFGGPGLRTLFITARTSLYGVETTTRGWHVHLDGPRTRGGPGSE